jgi:hypothetical protein
MSSCTLIALARPTFDVAAAERFYNSARALLADLGATINGPTSLIMTPEDTVSAEASLMHLSPMHLRQFLCSRELRVKFYYGRFANLVRLGIVYF